MAIHFTAIIASGVMVQDKFVNQHSCKQPISALSQRHFCFPSGFTLFTHKADVEKTIFEERIAGSSMDGLSAFRTSGVFPVEKTYALRGGAREPAVIVMDERLPEEWPHYCDINPALTDVLQTHGRYVRCFFTYYHH